MEFPGSLHNHTDYSNLRLRDAIVRYNELIDYAIELGHKAVAFTEHETIANAIKIEEYYTKVKQKHPDFKVILGNEIYLCRNDLEADTVESGEKFYHFVLLAKDAVGHQQIREISTRAWYRSWMQGKMRRVPTHYQDLVEIIGENPGHVIGSTACLGGFLPTKILENPNNNDNFVHWINLMNNLFGRGNFYLELQPSFQDEQISVNKKLIELSDITDTPYIFTTDTHYLKLEDRKIHEAYLKSQDGDREVADFYGSTYMMSTEEIEHYLTYLSKTEIERGYSNIQKIIDSCTDYSLLKPLKIPSLEWKHPVGIYNVPSWYDKIPYLKNFYESDFDGDNLLAVKVIEKISGDITLQTEEAYAELNSNLKTTWISSEVNKAHWSAYFLNLEKILDVCWDAGTLVGAGRGSGVGFLLLYVLGITQINPLRETTRTFEWRLTDRFKGLLCLVTSLK